MNWVATYLATKGCFEGLYKVNFFMKKSGTSELLTKENNYFHSRTSFWREEMGGVLPCRLLQPGWGEEMGSGRVEGWEWTSGYPIGGSENSRMADEDFISGEV